eukprot:GHVT01078446.1.p1 GENE.GHVT01078446.1~~GHVT01078446.1.p1  ORF type:complete len:337 (+),score=38.10 GHVT01078446.1:367-1377(+)
MRNMWGVSWLALACALCCGNCPMGRLVQALPQASYWNVDAVRKTDEDQNGLQALALKLQNGNSISPAMPNGNPPRRRDAPVLPQLSSHRKVNFNSSRAQFQRSGKEPSNVAMEAEELDQKVQNRRMRKTLLFGTACTMLCGLTVLAGTFAVVWGFFGTHEQMVGQGPAVVNMKTRQAKSWYDSTFGRKCVFEAAYDQLEKPDKIKDQAWKLAKGNGPLALRMVVFELLCPVGLATWHRIMTASKEPPMQSLDGTPKWLPDIISLTNIEFSNQTRLEKAAEIVKLASRSINDNKSGWTMMQAGEDPDINRIAEAGLNKELLISLPRGPPQPPADSTP